MIDVPKMGLDAIVNQDNGFDLFRVALGLGWKTPNTYWPTYPIVYINRITIPNAGMYPQGRPLRPRSHQNSEESKAYERVLICLF